MKQTTAFLLCLCFAALFAGCGGKSVENPLSTAAPPGAQQAIPTQTEGSSLPPGAPAPELPEASPAPFDSAAADLDITGSGTLAYAQLYAMTAAPEEYNGKTVCLRGEFNMFEDPSTGERYYACVIRDATACCAQGIEFEPAETLSYPEDFPSVGSEITVFGTFDSHQEYGIVSCTLRNAQFY